MTTTLRFLDLNIHNSWYRMLEQHVDYWHSLTSVRATEVIIERQQDRRIAFRARVRLEISTGTLHVDATGPTLKAALAEASQQLQHLIQARQHQRAQRRASEHPLTVDPMPRVLH